MKRYKWITLWFSQLLDEMLNMVSRALYSPVPDPKFLFSLGLRPRNLHFDKCMYSVRKSYGSYFKKHWLCESCKTCAKENCNC